ncbi:MAG: NTP transferase domain-containing protein [Candidatus Omnitrophica bacterium]|nr:NTP transferase domain-containing protein [Candidatus Omnitrophota bacterium]
MGAGAPPKCLMRVGGRSLLQRTLETLRSVGVTRAVLVVGHAAEAVATEARAHARGMGVAIVENPRYREGAILSLWAARGQFTTDLLIMDADVLCPPALLERLVHSPHPNAMLVDRQSDDTGEEQIVLGRGAQAWHITKRPSDELRRTLTPLGESIGFLKLSRAAAEPFRRLLESKIQSGHVGWEHEQVYPELFRAVPVYCEWADGSPWIEIDTPDDLRRAEQEILPQWAPAPCLNRVVAQAGLRGLGIARWPMTPNQWTGISLLVGLAAAASLADGRYPAVVLSAVLFQAFYIIDIWDGEIARARGLSSRWGSWWDLIVDGIVHTAYGWALAVGLHRLGGPPWLLGVGAVAAVGLALDFLVTAVTKLQGFGLAVYGDASRRGWATGRLPRWVAVNLTNENFSWLIVACLLLDLRRPLLVALAAGSHLFWIRYLWRSYNFAQARR